jgi:threonine dehydrogenase-like Zn-dependent dehydrogenase
MTHAAGTRRKAALFQHNGGECVMNVAAGGNGGEADGDGQPGRSTRRRSAGVRRVARAVWYTGPGKVELRTSQVDAPMPGQALVRTVFTGISRGTERLVLAGAVPESEYPRMRAPLQDGDFPFPVKYGYCAVGVVEAGPETLVGRTVFSLHPHQDHFVAPVGMLCPVPDSVPARRATLAANMETALNAMWDSGAGPADRIVVVGAGIVGLLIAYLAARLPGADVTVVDVADERRTLVEGLGARFVTAQGSPTVGEPVTVPQSSRRQPGLADVVFHTSVSAAGLNTALAMAGMEATVVELSWYGDRDVPTRLGGAFHSQRLRLVSSQVGQVSPGRRPRWDYRRRLEAALRLLADPGLDPLVADEIAFADAPTALPVVLGPGASGLPPVIRY